MNFSKVQNTTIGVIVPHIFADGSEEHGISVPLISKEEREMLLDQRFGERRKDNIPVQEQRRRLNSDLRKNHS